jgi:hypothetical protein
MAVYAVEDICNLALRDIGYPTPIGNIYEGSMASRVLLDIYGQERDDLLRERDWEFARQTVSLGAPIKTAPAGGYGAGGWNSTYPPIPWILEYAYPSGIIEVRTLLPAPIFLPEFLPRPVYWEKVNDPTLNNGAGATVIVTDLFNAQATVTGQVYNPALWTDAGFIQALVDKLAQKLLRPLMGEGDPNTEQLAAAQAQSSAVVAGQRQG